MLSQLRIRHRIALLVIGALLLMIATANYDLLVLRNSILEDRRAETREIVNVAYSVAEYYGKQAEAGKMPVETAREMAQTTIAAMRYEGDNYFSQYDTSYHMVRHPFKAELNGKDLAELKDSTGKRIVVVDQAAGEMSRIAHSISSSAHAVDELGEASRKISDIVAVIREIADQTNLLALNAAIEAARAGETGRDFAVVADEVRKLAERTAQSTQQISQMITSIQGQTEQAVAGIRQVVTDIAHAATEQHQASNTISGHIENISRQAHDNAVAIDEVAVAAQGLETMAERMQAEISHFKV